MVEHKATEVCLVAQAGYPEERRATLVTAPPIGYLLRIQRDTPETTYRCIYSLADGRKIHKGSCRFESWTPEESPASSEPADAPEVESAETPES